MCVWERVREREKVITKKGNMRKGMTTHCWREWVGRSEPEKAKERKWERGKERERESECDFHEISIMVLGASFNGELDNVRQVREWVRKCVCARVRERMVRVCACHLKVCNSLDFLQIKSEWLPISPTNLSYLFQRFKLLWSKVRDFPVWAEDKFFNFLSE